MGASAKPLYSLWPGAKLVVSVDGEADDEAVFDASAANANTGAAEPFALADGMELEVHVDYEHYLHIVFAEDQFADITQATAAEVAAVLNAALRGAWAQTDGLASDHVRIWSDRQGHTSALRFMAGGANDVLQFPTAEVTGSGNVADIHRVTGEEFESVVEEAIDGITVEWREDGTPELVTESTGSGASVQVREASYGGFGFDNDLHIGSETAQQTLATVVGKDFGAYANLIEVRVSDAMFNEDEFSLAVIQDGVYRESFPNLSMDPSSEHYIETVLNDDRTGSNFIRISDQHVEGSPLPPQQEVQLSGGDDGLDGLDDNDFIGDTGDDGISGLWALILVNDLSLLMVPGRATPAVHDAMLSFCEQMRMGEVFAVLDPPRDGSFEDVVEYVESTASLLESSEYGAIYWPWVKVLNPSKSVFGSREQVAAPPSGVVCGVYARTDAARPGGVYDPPAGIEKGRLFGVLGFDDESVLVEQVRDWVYPKRINPLTTAPGLPRYIDGSRTLKATGNFPYVAERRGVIFIERSLKQARKYRPAPEQHRAAARGGPPDDHDLPAPADERRRLRQPGAREGLLRRRLGRPQPAVRDHGRPPQHPRRPRHEQAGRVHRAAHQPGHPRARGRTRRGQRLTEDKTMAIIGNPRSFHKKFKFVVEIDGVVHAGFQKASELSVEAAKVEYFEGGALIPNKSPGRLTFADVTLERGATRDRDLFNWFQDVALTASGLGLPDPGYKRNLDIVQQDRDGSTLRRWSLSGAWPVKLWPASQCHPADSRLRRSRPVCALRTQAVVVAGEWDNESDENVIESVTLTFDYFELVQ